MLNRKSPNFTFVVKSINDNRLLIVVSLLYVLFWYFHPKILIASDPMGYSRHAFEMISGRFFTDAPTHIFAHRLGVVFPTAVFYKLFGIGPATTHLWPLIMTLTTMAVIWWVTPAGYARSLAVLLFALSPLQFNNSTSLYPDVITSGFMMVAAASLFYRQRSVNSVYYRRILPFMAAFSMIAAFSAKGSAYWMLPFWAGVMIADLCRRRYGLLRSFYLPHLLWLLAFGIAYLAICNAVWGSPWARFESLLAIQDQHLWNWDGNWNNLIPRLTYEPLQLLIHSFLPGFALAMTVIFSLKKSNRFWAFYAGVIIFIWWFGSVSLTSYQPLPLAARMITPALPVICILGGMAISRLLSRPKSGRITGFIPELTVISVLIVGSIIHKHPPLVEITGVVICLVCLWGLSSLSSSNEWNWRRLVVILSAVGLVGGQLLNERLINSFKAEPVERIIMRDIRNELSKPKMGNILLICSDPRSTVSLEYFFEYEYPPNLDVFYFGNCHGDPDKKYDRVLYFINKGRSEYLHWAYDSEVFDEEIREMTVLPAIFEMDDIQLLRGKSVNGRFLLPPFK